MAEMNSEERMLRVLQRQVPDRVPHFEWLVDRRVREAIYPDCKNYLDFALKMGHDAVISKVTERGGYDNIVAAKWRAGVALWR